VTGPKRLALLTYLALAAPAFQRRDTLVGLLWPELDQFHARNSLRNLLHALRRELGGGALVSRGAEEIGLDPLRFCCDATEFESAIDSKELERSLELYRGELMEGFFLSGAPEFEHWLERKRSLLHERAARAAWALTEQRESRGDYAGAVEWARRAAALSPYDEGRLRRLITLMDRQGDRVGALEEYRVFTRRLSQELEVDPSPETRELVKDLRSPQRGGADDGPPLRGLQRQDVPIRSRPALPLPVTSLIGREAEVAAVEQLVLDKDVRLVTLTGAGGVGKTRLALQAAANLLNEFERGVAFTTLASVNDPALVISSIARALAVRESEVDLLRAVEARLREAPLLLLLDNFEHVLPAAPVVAELLKECPKLKVLTTSRSILRLQGENEFRVSPLGVPDAGDLPPLEILLGYPAVALFVQRARAIRSDFRVTAENARAVAQICAKLDGLPLALELAAARIKLLSPDDMLARLQSGLRVLTGGALDLPQRHRTMRGAIEWSYDLLTDETKRLFRRLAVFVGGFTVQTVEAVCTAMGERVDVLEGVGALVDQSLLQPVEAEEDQPRFAMLQTIHDYALERLLESGEEHLIRDRHVAHVLSIAEAAEKGLKGEEEVLWLRRLELDHGNVRAALGWATERGAMESAARICVGIWDFWSVHGHLSEGRAWLEKVMQQDGELPAELRARTRNRAGALACEQSEYDRASALLDEGLALARATGATWEIAFSLNNLGFSRHCRGDQRGAIGFYEQALAINRAESNLRGTAIVLNNLAGAFLDLASPRAAMPLLLESLELHREMGHQKGQAIALSNLGDLARSQGELKQSESFYEEALELSRQLEGRHLEAMILCNLGHLARDQKNTGGARSFYGKSMLTAFEENQPRSVAWATAGLAELAMSDGDVRRAVELYASAISFLETVSSCLPPDLEGAYQKTVATARAQLGDSAFAMLWARGQAKKPEKAIAFALKDAGIAAGTRSELPSITTPPAHPAA
jgi:predicted ATPase/DNA-binding SARP family transcriptional activator